MTELTHYLSTLLTQIVYFRSRMGAGSNFTVQMAFNARGYGDFGADPHYAPNLNPDTFTFRDEFLWVTHTWNHIDMYCVLSNCATPLVWL